MFCFILFVCLFFFKGLWDECNGKWEVFASKKQFELPFNLTSDTKMMVSNETCDFDNDDIPRVICVKFDYASWVPGAIHQLFDGTYERMQNWEQVILFFFFFFCW